MKKWLRRIRGAVGTALTWAAGWSVVGAIIWVVVVVFSGGGAGLFFLLVTVVWFARLGFVGGAVFSVVLGIAEGRRRFDQMSLPRFAGWGALGGLLLFMLLGGGGGSTLAFVVTASVMTLMGAGSAAGSLALARRADDRESLETGEDVAEIGLTNAEKVELLGE